MVQYFVECQKPNTRERTGTRRAGVENLFGQDDGRRRGRCRTVIVGHECDPALDALARVMVARHPDRQRTVGGSEGEEHQ